MATRPARRRTTAATARSAPLAGRRSPWRRYAPVLFLAAVFSAKLLVLWQLHDHPLLQPKGEMDSGVYLDLARRVAGGDLLAGHRVFFVSPFYVYFLGAALAASGGSVFVAQILQLALGTAAVWLVAVTARLWRGGLAAWIAAGLAALCGYVTFNELLILQSAVDPFLAALALWLLARAWTTGRLPAFALAGLLLGVHMLNRPNVGIWAAAAVILTLLPLHEAHVAPGFNPIRSWRRHLVRAAVLAAGIAAALLPAAARNYAVAGAFAPVSSHGGLNFYIGNNPSADGTYHLVAGVTPSIAGQERDMRAVAERESGRTLTDSEASSWFYRRAWGWIRSSPVAAVRLFARKVVYAFNATDLPLNFSYAYYRDEAGTILPFLFVGAWLLLPLGLAGLWLGRPAIGNAGPSGRGVLLQPDAADGGDRQPDGWWRWAGFIPIYGVSVAVFFVAGRYRLPLLVACCVSAAGALATLWERLRRGSRRSFAVALAPVAALALVTNLDLGLEEGKGGERTEMLLYQIDTRQDEAARALLERTVVEDRQPALVLFRAAQAYRARGDAAAAIPLYERARRLAPSDGAIQLGLGQALFDTGRGAEAVPRLRAAVAAGTGGGVAWFDLARALAATGDRAGAAAALREIGAPATLDAASQLAVGRLALDLGDAPRAETFLSPAAAHLPENAGAQASLGLALGLLGRREDAIAALEAASRLAPTESTVRLNLAVMYAEAGRTDEARRVAEEALRLRPGYEQAQRFLQALRTK